MLGDHARTAGYLEAIRATVRPGDVVVDIGTGSGVLAAAAAQAGARRVYAIEPGGIRRSARRLFEANGLADRIMVIPTWSYQAALPERADVLLSELIGNDPLSEGVVGATRDALARLLKPGARLVPSTVALYGLPVSIPDRELEKLSFRPATLNRWRGWYGIDFSALAAAREPPLFRHFVNPREMGNWRPLTAPIQLATVALRSWHRPWIYTSRAATVDRPGELNGVVVYFELKTGPKTFVSTHPQRIHETNHWESPVQLLDDPIAVNEGERLRVTYWYGFIRRISGCWVETSGPSLDRTV